MCVLGVEEGGGGVTVGVSNEDDDDAFSPTIFLFFFSFIFLLSGVSITSRALLIIDGVSVNGDASVDSPPWCVRRGVLLNTSLAIFSCNRSPISGGSDCGRGGRPGVVAFRDIPLAIDSRSSSICLWFSVSSSSSSSFFVSFSFSSFAPSVSSTNLSASMKETDFCDCDGDPFSSFFLCSSSSISIINLFLDLFSFSSSVLFTSS